MIKNISLNNNSVSIIFDDQLNLLKKGVISIMIKVADFLTFKLIIDERYNSIDIDEVKMTLKKNEDPSKYSNEYIYDNYIGYFLAKFKDLMVSDFRYKIGDGFQGTKVIYAIDFINYLTKCNRENNITKILND